MAGVRARSLAWVLVALAFADLVFFSGASNFLASPQSRILNQVLIGGAILVAGLLALRQRADLRSTLLLPGAAWLAANTLSAIFSQRPAASLEALALLLLCAPGYLVVRAIVRDPGLRLRTDWLVVLSTAVFVIAYLAQAFTQWVTWWSVAGPSLPPLRPGDVGLTVGTVNAVALYLELLAPIAIWLAGTAGDRARRPRGWRCSRSLPWSSPARAGRGSARPPVRWCSRSSRGGRPGFPSALPSRRPRDG